LRDDSLKALDRREYSGCISAQLFISLPIPARWFAAIA
jgi:hypothetical protein